MLLFHLMQSCFLTLNTQFFHEVIVYNKRIMFLGNESEKSMCFELFSDVFYKPV